MRFLSFLHASLIIIIIIASIVCSSDAAIQYVNGATIFGSCINFCIQAKDAVSFDGVQTKIITGNVGVAPGTGITGTVMLGKDYTEQANTPSAISCTASETSTYLQLTAVTCSHTLNAELSGVTLFPGVYCIVSDGLTLTTGALYLDAQGDVTAQFIIQTTTTLTTGANTHIILLHGALARNVYWQVGTSATLGASSFFRGQILAHDSVSVGNSATVIGRIFAQAAVTFAGNGIATMPSQF